MNDGVDLRENQYVCLVPSLFNIYYNSLYQFSGTRLTREKHETSFEDFEEALYEHNGIGGWRR